jgi:hypothetical protein
LAKHKIAIIIGYTVLPIVYLKNMKTVILTNNKKAIPLIIKHYVTDNTMIKAITELVHQGTLDLTENKSDIIKKVRDLLYYQGRTVYGDWYEDTDQTEPINRIYEKVIIFVKDMFPEYYW